jgi:hypothetical protein
VNTALSSRPTTPLTVPARLSGMLTLPDGERTVLPCTLYIPKAVPKAACACATVPSAAT